MIISRLCLALASTFVICGGHATAKDVDKDASKDDGTNVEATNTAATTSGNNVAGEEVKTFVSNFQGLPEYTYLDNPLTFSYSIDENQADFLLRNPTSLFLCQTTANAVEPINSRNVWTVLGIGECFEPGKCKNQTLQSNVAVPIDIVLEPFDFAPEDETNYFFFCLAGLHVVLEQPTWYCQSYSTFFTIHRPPIVVKNGPSRIVTTEQDSGSETQSGTPTDAANTEIPLPTPSPPIFGPPSAPNGPLRMDRNIQHIVIQGRETPTPNPGPTSSSMTTVTATTATSTGFINAVSNGNHQTASKLSTAAIIGISLGGAIVFLLLALLALFCIRRRRKNRTETTGTGPEQVMLTQAHHDNNNSRDLIHEKENVTVAHALIHPNSNSSSFLMHDTNGNTSNNATTGTAIPYTETRPFINESSSNNNTEPRHSALPTFTKTPSLPYTGTATSPPRRKPTNASQASAAVSALSRTPSSSTTISMTSNPPHHASSTSPYTDFPSTSHNANNQTQLLNISEEALSGVNVGGGVAGTTKYNTSTSTGNMNTNSSGGMKQSFLSEPGMSPEEVERLEEEERRIDDAIAAAEEARSRERERAGSGLR